MKHIILLATTFILSIVLTTSCSMYALDKEGLYDDGGGNAVPYGYNGLDDEGFEGNSDRFDTLAENPFIKVTDQQQSTFSVDADGASYAIMRSYVNHGYQVNPYSVRTEEYLNYFTFDYPDPIDGKDVAINAEIGDCPWQPEHKLLRLGIKGKSIADADLPQANFVFMIDVSGSMGSSDKLPLLKKGLIELLKQLKPTDRVAIVTYSGHEELLLGSTPASEVDLIESKISSLTAQGATSGASALEMAYNEAKKNFIEGGNNRIIMGTDGDFNVGISSTEGLLELVESYRNDGIYLTVCGFGLGNLNDGMMEAISNAGNGTYNYIDCEDELMKVFYHERSQMVSVANDAKVQITFDSAQVESYRLIGYENRVLDNQDFADDTKDAAEIGAGQTITALYEIIPTEQWQTTQPIGTYDFRYKQALNASSVALGIDIDNYVGSESENLNFAAGVAAYSLVLRNSEYKGNATKQMAIELVDNNRSFDPLGLRKQLVELISKIQ